MAALLIAVVDWKIKPNVSLGFLYVVQMLVVSLSAHRMQIGIAAAICGVLRELLGATALGRQRCRAGAGGVIAFMGSGLFVADLARNRRLAIEHEPESRQQIELREEVQDELRVLVESSPAAIFTLDAGARVLLANEASHRLLAFDQDALRGETMRPYLPALASALERPLIHLRTNMECVDRRRSGEMFLAHIWFSSYTSGEALRLAVLSFSFPEPSRVPSRAMFGSSHPVRGGCFVVRLAQRQVSVKSNRRPRAFTSCS